MATTSTGSSSGPLHRQEHIRPLGSADQACKECRRRKAKCDRAIPTCSLCIKYRRHCLYEKHSRTPLTRRYLTEVEEKLEQAEALVAHFKALVPPQFRQGGPSSRSRDDHAPTEEFNFASAPATSSHVVEEPPSQAGQAATRASSTAEQEHRHPPPAPPLPIARRNDTINNQIKVTRTSPPDQQRERDILEASPADDFEWDEQDTLTNYSASPDAAGQDDTHVEDGSGPDSAADGMASLNVGEREAGYLGVASGAALLRILEPTPRPRTQSPANPRTSSLQGQQQQPLRDPFAPSLYPQPDPGQHIADSMIDAYFSLYHLSYPLVHEASFRAQYSGVIPRPSGACWAVLAYTMAAIGVYTTSPSSTGSSAGDGLDVALFAHARSILSFNFLEVGNVALVQALTLMANYLQKRNKPNSAYNYLGLAVRMAMGLGLHKEFQGWNISPLKMEIRRRVWWVLCVIDVGATVTFSRPSVFPFLGIEVSLPMNVDDRSLTAMSKSYPPESDGITPYTAVRTQASFHVATDPIYTRVISKPLPTADEMLRLDEELLQPWLRSVPACFDDSAAVPPRYTFAQYVKRWRYLNMRIIMYRPFVIRKALNVRDRRPDESPEDGTAYERCLGDARDTIASIGEYWDKHEHNRIAAWYALYFLFQAALIPCICLRNEPSSSQASDWKAQISTTTRTIAALASHNSSSSRCYQVIMDLCGDFIESSSSQSTAQQASSSSGASEDQRHASMAGVEGSIPAMPPEPTDTSPQTQINSVLSMMWPNVQPLEAADVVMGDDAWMDFLKGGTINDGDDTWFNGP